MIQTSGPRRKSGENDVGALSTYGHNRLHHYAAERLDRWRRLAGRDARIGSAHSRKIHNEIFARHRGTLFGHKRIIGMLRDDVAIRIGCHARHRGYNVDQVGQSESAVNAHYDRVGLIGRELVRNLDIQLPAAEVI